MSVVFYPSMGVDLVTPLLCCPRVEKIYCFGLPAKRFGKHRDTAIKKQLLFQNSVLMYGNNSFYIEDDDEYIQFFDEYDPEVLGENEIIKQHHFKKKQLVFYQFRYMKRIITVYWYYAADVTDKEWPISETVDYVIHHPIFKWRTQKTLPQIEQVCKPGHTRLIAPKAHLIDRWGYKSAELKKVKPIERYQVIVEQARQVALDTDDEGQCDLLPLLDVEYRQHVSSQQ